MIKNFTSCAVIILDKEKLLSEMIKYFYKFNIKKIIILNFTNKKITTKKFSIYCSNLIILNLSEKKFEFNILKKKKIYNILDDTYILVNGSKFINMNLFKLYETFKINTKKLIINLYKKNQKFINTEYYILKKNKINLYDFKFKNLKDKQKYYLNYTNESFIDISNKNLSIRKIDTFFSLIYSKLIILDRDGVINEDKGYVGNKKNFTFQNGALRAIKYLNNKNYNIFVVSNQSGIARGYFTNQDVLNLHQYLRDTLANNHCFINKIYYSPYHVDGIVKKYSLFSHCRKPGIKLFKILIKEWKIKFTKNTYMIGDQITDMQFAKKAKIRGAQFRNKNLFKFIKKLSI